MPGYREIEPPEELMPWVEAVWIRRGQTAEESAAGAQVHRVLPDGRIDFLFDLRGRPHAALVGTMTRCQVVRREPDEDFLGVRFRPGGAAALLGHSVDSFTDCQPRLADLLGHGIERLTVELSRMAPEGRLEVLFAELLERLHRAVQPNALASVAAAQLDELNGAASVSGLARELGVTRQHLTRCFRRVVGIGPKTYARVARFQAARKRALSSHITDWAEIAYCSGYTDQSHLIADFRRLTGLTPVRLTAD